MKLERLQEHWENYQLIFRFEEGEEDGRLAGRLLEKMRFFSLLKKEKYSKSRALELAGLSQEEFVTGQKLLKGEIVGERKKTLELFNRLLEEMRKEHGSHVELSRGDTESKTHQFCDDYYEHRFDRGRTEARLKEKVRTFFVLVREKYSEARAFELTELSEQDHVFIMKLLQKFISEGQDFTIL